MEKVNKSSQSIFTDIDVFLPNLTHEQKSVALQVSEKPKNPSLCEDINKLGDVLFPVDPVTGNPDNMVDKLISPNVNPMEKERILSFMQKMPASKRNNLSDKELMNMLPSRYNSTLTDIDKVRDFFENEIYTQLDDESKQEDSTSQGNEESQSTD
ncbi:MAG: hypothetical protein SPJ90_04230 [Prevotella sp.]|nr:hypothetical protein [Prevotellaceae bacterium]MDY5843618.1 hypothetical protein [Prevotella sp.]